MLAIDGSNSDAFVPEPLYSNSRAALFTGRYKHWADPSKKVGSEYAYSTQPTVEVISPKPQYFYNQPPKTYSYYPQTQHHTYSTSRPSQTYSISQQPQTYSNSWAQKDHWDDRWYVINPNYYQGPENSIANQIPAEPRKPEPSIQPQIYHEKRRTYTPEEQQFNYNYLDTSLFELPNVNSYEPYPKPKKNLKDIIYSKSTLQTATSLAAKVAVLGVASITNYVLTAGLISFFTGGTLNLGNFNHTFLFI